ncbi:hypothetical protein ACHWQZ_G005964 [Mnemiopsis leidyi]
MLTPVIIVLTNTSFTEMPADKKESEPTDTIVITSECELRFEVESDEVSLVLVDGQAEIFGTEIPLNKVYKFVAGLSIAVFSWRGCRLKITGNCNSRYISKQTPMVVYLQTHGALQQMRNNAERDDKDGPRILVVGPQDVGKSTLCRLLCNYAVRMKQQPVYVDLDVGQGCIGIPGSIGALVLERQADVEEGFTEQLPIVYHFGYYFPDANWALYNELAKKIADDIEKRSEFCPKARHSGFVVNTCGYVTGDGYKFIKEAVDIFKINCILVIDHERVFNDLQRDIPEDKATSILLPKSGGVIKRNGPCRKRTRESRVKQYFYGFRRPLNPFVFNIGFDEIEIYKIGSLEVSDSLLPINKVSDIKNKLSCVKIDIDNDLIHTVLSLVFGEPPDLLCSTVAGFIVVKDVDMENRQINVLAPAPHPLPHNVCLWSDTKFNDEGSIS